MSESRKRFNFSIKDLLWLMLVVGVASGWCAHFCSWRVFRDQMNSRQDTLEAEQDALKATLVSKERFYGAELAEQKRYAQMMYEHRAQVVKEILELKRQLGLKEPPADASEQYKAIWQTNQILAEENKSLRLQLLGTKSSEWESFKSNLLRTSEDK
jgi:hypothetical protein